jgi:hypothetical protein
MTPTEGMGKLCDVEGHVLRLASAVRDEAGAVYEQWEALVAVGGGRDDHAAALLARLRGPLDELSRFCSTVSGQITGMVADPFGRKAG